MPCSTASLVEPQWAARPTRGQDLEPLLERIEAHLAGRTTLADPVSMLGA